MNHQVGSRAAAGLVEGALVLAVVTLGVDLVKVTVDKPAWLGEYHSDTRTLIMLDDLTPREEAMVWAHELCHMRLHPPGTDDVAPRGHSDTPEEILVHHAAAVVCADAGVGGYRRTMLGRGVPVELFPVRLPKGRLSERDRLADDVRAALSVPRIQPDW